MSGGVTDSSDIPERTIRVIREFTARQLIVRGGILEDNVMVAKKSFDNLFRSKELSFPVTNRQLNGFNPFGKHTRGVQGLEINPVIAKIPAVIKSKRNFAGFIVARKARKEAQIYQCLEPVADPDGSAFPQQ